MLVFYFVIFGFVLSHTCLLTFYTHLHQMPLLAAKTSLPAIGSMYRQNPNFKNVKIQKT